VSVYSSYALGILSSPPKRVVKEALSESEMNGWIEEKNANLIDEL
jgi:hypothetical protein